MFNVWLIFLEFLEFIEKVYFLRKFRRLLYFFIGMVKSEEKLEEIFCFIVLLVFFLILYFKFRMLMVVCWVVFVGIIFIVNFSGR